MAIKKPEGTEDLLPEEAAFWNLFKQTAFDVFARYGYAPVETPVFEQTDLFVRGIGEATDVVSKEMFLAVSGANMEKLKAGEVLRSKSRLSLRPEGTAGVVRAVSEHGLVEPGGAPVKLMYAGPMFRAERPQKGRQRQFNQVGIECLGADAPSIDAEGIIMLMRFYQAIGIPQENLRLLVNSMGCEACRPAYRDAVAAYIFEHSDEMCEDCLRRAQINPLRAFDCKEEGCSRVMANAPKITDALCDDCREHYGAVKAYLDAAGVNYVEDPTLVRGLDYYTRTVFEVQVTDGMGSQNAIGGGGRYDKLMEEIGGKPCAGFGFALGYERCLLALQAAGFEFAPARQMDIYIACVEESMRPHAFQLLQALRDAGVHADVDHQGRSLKSQLKQANKANVRAALILGPDELASGVVKLRDMSQHDERDLNWNDTIEYLRAHADAADVNIDTFLAR